MEESTNLQESGTGKMSILTKLGLIFTSPGKVFEHLDSHKDWLIPLLLVIVIAIARTFIMQDLEIAAIKDRIVQNEQIPEEQKTAILERIDQDAGSTSGQVRSVAGIIIMTFVFALVVAGLYLFTGNVVMGGNASFSKLLSVYALGSLVIIPEQIVKTALALSKGSTAVYTSLAIMFDSTESGTLLFSLANAVDIFSIWRLALWALGFGILYKFSQAKSWMAVGIWYVIGIFIYYGLNRLTGGMLG